MTRKVNNSTFKLLFGAVTELLGVIIGLVGQGFFLGLGFWWAFHLLMN